MSRRGQLLRWAKGSLAAVVDFILQLEARVRLLQAEVKHLKERLAQNSRNSSKPPSADGLAKPAPKSLRKKSPRKRGGQNGHPGKTLEPVPEPDHLVVHCLDHCTCGRCGGRSLRRQPVVDYEKRQVFDLPPNCWK